MYIFFVDFPPRTVSRNRSIRAGAAIYGGCGINGESAIQTPHYVNVVGLLFLVTRLLQRMTVTIVVFEVGDSNLMRCIPMMFLYGIMGHIVLTLNRYAGLGNVKPCNSYGYLTLLWCHSMEIST